MLGPSEQAGGGQSPCFPVAGWGPRPRVGQYVMWCTLLLSRCVSWRRGKRPEPWNAAQQVFSRTGLWISQRFVTLGAWPAHRQTVSLWDDTGLLGRACCSWLPDPKEGFSLLSVTSAPSSPSVSPVSKCLRPGRGLSVRGLWGCEPGQATASLQVQGGSGSPAWPSGIPGPQRLGLFLTRCFEPVSDRALVCDRTPQRQGHRGRPGPWQGCGSGRRLRWAHPRGL